MIRRKPIGLALRAEIAAAPDRARRARYSIQGESQRRVRSSKRAGGADREIIALDAILGCVQRPGRRSRSPVARGLTVENRAAACLHSARLHGGASEARPRHASRLRARSKCRSTDRSDSPARDTRFAARSSASLRSLMRPTLLWSRRQSRNWRLLAARQ